MEAEAWLPPRAAIAVLGLVMVAAAGPEPPPADDTFTVVVFGGEKATLHLPLLATIPALDRDAACVLVKQHNAKARELNAHPPPDQDDDDPALDIYKAAETGCVSAAELDYEFYQELSTLLDHVAGGSRTRPAVNQMLGAMRESLRTAQTLEQSQEALQAIQASAIYLAEPLHDSTMFLIAAEAAAPLLRFCGSDEKAAECGRDANVRSGDALADAGRWLGRADLLQQAEISLTVIPEEDLGWSVTRTGLILWNARGMVTHPSRYRSRRTPPRPCLLRVSTPPLMQLLIPLSSPGR